MPLVRSLVICALASTGVVAAQQQEPTFRTGTNTVSVYTTVLDPAGRLVPDLKQEDFDVLDNGKLQKIDVFSNAIRPITIVVMLDRSGSMMRNFELERKAAVQFVSDLLPDDKARLGSFAYRVEIDPDHFTSNRDELIRILYEDLQDGGPTPLWNATAAAMTALEHQDGRRVVLMLTDGYDNPMRESISMSFEQVRIRSEAEEMMVYGIGMSDDCGRAPASGSGPSIMLQRGGWPRGMPWPPPPPPPGGGRGGGGGGYGRGFCAGNDKPDPHLRELSWSSGGGYYELQRYDDLGSTFARIADELHHQYLLGFTAQTLDNKVHQLEVKLHRPELTARARKSYVATASTH